MCIDGSVLIGYSNRSLCKIKGEDLVKEDATVPRAAQAKSSYLYNTFTTIGQAEWQERSGSDLPPRLLDHLIDNDQEMVDSLGVAGQIQL